ncbi:hypothetical protein ACSBQT_08425 [Brevibacterium sp. H602]|uniref:hypothetical protein n=1 Tax=Brevibacterium sp. H602 TaxID=3444316 RepID=UPI003EB6A48C
MTLRIDARSTVGMILTARAADSVAPVCVPQLYQPVIVRLKSKAVSTQNANCSSSQTASALTLIHPAPIVSTGSHFGLGSFVSFEELIVTVSVDVREQITSLTCADDHLLVDHDRAAPEHRDLSDSGLFGNECTNSFDE